MNTTALPAGYGISVTLEATPHQFGNVLELIRSSDNEMGNIYASLEQALKVSQNSVSVEVLKSEIESQGRTIRRTSRKEMLKRNYAKTFDGLFTRLCAKISAVAVLQYTNFLNNRNINRLKHALAV